MGRRSLRESPLTVGFAWGAREGLYCLYCCTDMPLSAGSHTFQSYSLYIFQPPPQFGEEIECEAVSRRAGTDGARPPLPAAPLACIRCRRRSCFAVQRLHAPKER